MSCVAGLQFVLLIVRETSICTINSTRDLYIYVDKNYIFEYAENYEEDE